MITLTTRWQPWNRKEKKEMEEEKSALAVRNQELTERNQELEDALRDIRIIAEEVHKPVVAYSHNKQEMMEAVISNVQKQGSRILDIIDNILQT